MTKAQRAERHRFQLIAAAAAAGQVPIEVTADGVRLRDDWPIGYEVTDVGHLVLDVADDAPIPFVVAS